MQVSIAGANGFIGSRLVSKLQEAGINPLIIKREDLLGEPTSDGWGTLIWAAGLTADFRSRPFDTISAHVSDLNNLLRLGKVSRLVYLSSTRVYQRNSNTDELNDITVLPVDPSDIYNLSKLLGESLSLSSGIPEVAIARLSNIIGPGEITRETFLGSICRDAKNGHIDLQSAAHSTKDYLWIDDATRIISTLALDDFCGIINVASGRQTSHYEWAESICKETGATLSVTPNATEISFPRIETGTMLNRYGPPSTEPLSQIKQLFYI